MKRLATIVLVSALALVAACGKDKKKDGPAAGSATAGSTTGSAAGSAAVVTPPTDPAGQAAAAAGQAAAAAGQAAAAAGQAAAAAQGQGAAAVAGAEMTEAQVAEVGGRMLTLMESVAGAVEANTADCGAMATAVEKVLNDNQATIAELKAKASGSTNDAKFEAWMAQNQARAQAVSTRLGPGMTKCSGEARLQEAFSKLDI